jgi:hypothetical protein
VGQAYDATTRLSINSFAGPANACRLVPGCDPEAPPFHCQACILNGGQ